MEMGVAMRMLHKPGATEHVTLPGEEIRNVELGFKLADVTAARQGDDLVLSFADGAQLVFSEYFQIHDGNFPELNFADGLRHLGPDDIRTDWERPHDKVEAEPGGREDGSDGAQSGVSADSGADARASAPEQGTPSPAQEAQIQAALQQNDAPRAGPNSLGSVQESNYHAWEELDLLDGRPHLGPLDIGWNRGWNQENPHTSAGRRDDGEDGSILDGNAVVSPAPGDQTPPNSPPLITSAALILDSLDEAGVVGNRDGLTGGPNDPYVGKTTANGSAAALDPDGDALTWLVRGTGGSGASAETTYGSVSINPDGSYTYTLDASRSNILAQGETKTDSFVLLVSDGRGGTAEETVVVTITGTNDAPVLNFVEGEDGSHRLHYSGETVKGALEVADPDADGKLSDNASGHVTQQFSITGDSGTTGTSGQGIDGSATFEVSGKGILTVNADGSYSFVSSTAVLAETTLKFNVTTTDAHTSVSNTKTITVTLTPNKQPQITSTEHDHAVTESGVTEGGNEAFAGIPTVTGKITGSDADNDDLTYAIKDVSSGPDGSSTKIGTYGSLTLQPDGQYTYTLTNDENSAADKLAFDEAGTEDFTVTVSDGHGDSVEQIITVKVTGTNDKPVLSFNSDSTGAHTFKDNGKTQTGTGAFAVTDPDADGELGGSTGGNANQRFSIVGSDGTVGSGGTPRPDGSTSFITECGTLTIKKDGSYSYQIDPTSEKVLALGTSQKHTEHFTIQVTDAHGAVSGTLPITVEITGKNDPPKISGATGTHPVREAGVTAHSNVDDPGTSEVHGSLSAEHTDGDAHDEITFTLANSVNVTGGGSSSVTLSDERTLKTDYGTLKLTPTGHTDGKYGCGYSFELDNKLVNTLPEGQTVTLKFKVQATDESGTHSEDLIVTITGSNDRPEITAIDRPSAVAEDGASLTTGQVSATDVDTGDSLNYSLADAGGATVQILEGKYGRLEIIQGTGEYKYYLNNDKAQSLAEGETGLDAFTVRVTDQWGAYTEKTLEIPITGKDDLPVLGNLTASVTEDNGAHDVIDTPLLEGGRVTATDTDALDTERTFVLESSVDNVSPVVKGDGGTYTVEGKYGTLTFHSDGTYSYKLDKNSFAEIQGLNEEDSRTDSFQITVNSGHSGKDGVAEHFSSTTGNLVITIQGSNDNPEITSGTYDLSFDSDTATSAQGQLAISDVDDSVNLNNDATATHNHTFYFEKDGAKLQSFANEDGYGTLTVDQFTGKYTYILNEYSDLSVDRVEHFTITVEDAHGGKASQAIDVNVGQRDTPITTPGGSYTLNGAKLSVTEDNFAADTTNVQDIATATGGNPSVKQFYGFNVDGFFRQTVTGDYGTITINKENGACTYTLNNDLSSVQSLSVRDHLTESFQLWGLGSGVINVTITGSNDQPVVTLKEDNPPFELTQKDDSDVSISGTALVTDTDTAHEQAGHTSDTHEFWLDAAATSREAYYKFTLDGSGKINGVTPTDADDADYKVGITAGGVYTLTYLAGRTHLTADDSTTVSFDVYAKDNSGAIDGSAVSEKVTVTATINGTNAAPVWGELEGKAVTEDDFSSGGSTNISVSGNLLTDGHVTDDTGQAADSGLSFSIIRDGGGATSLLKGQYGTLLISDARTGEYTYTLDNTLDAVQALGVGASLTEHFTFRVTDKHGGYSEKEFTVTVNGTNDAPTLAALSDLTVTATANSALTQDVSATAKGHDVDTEDVLSYAFSYDNDANGGKDYHNYGSFKIDASTGLYTFTLDNSKEAVKNLSDSDSQDLRFSVTVSDTHGGSASQDLSVQISGVNDAPEIIAGKEGDLAVLGHSGDFDNYIRDPDLVKGGTEHQALTYTASHGDDGAAATEVRGQYGSLHIEDDGTYTYTPNSSPDLIYNDTFTLFACDPNGAETKVEITIKNTGGPAPTTLSLSSLLTDAPEEGDSPLFSSLIAENASLDSLLGGADNADNTDNVPAPADPAALPGLETAHAAAPLSAPVELAAPSGGQEEAVARMMVEQAV